MCIPSLLKLPPVFLPTPPSRLIQSPCLSFLRYTANSHWLSILHMLGSKITEDGDCSHEIKRHLLLGRKVITNLDSIFKSRDITLPTKVCLVKATVFPAVRYGCESWTVKKAERRRIDAFELWCWRTLESPLDCKEIQPVHSEGDQPWEFFGKTDSEAETPTLWPPHAKS